MATQKDQNKFRFALGLMTGTVLALLLTWVLSGSSITEENPCPPVQETAVAEEKEKVKTLNIKPVAEAKEAVLSLDKMKVVYVGVDNPLTVDVPSGVDLETLNLECSACDIQGWKGKYKVIARKPGIVMIKVTGDQIPAKEYEFRVKRIPDPIARLGKSTGGVIGTGVFKSEQGLGAFLDNFDFDASCKIQGFLMNRLVKKGTKEEAVNAGARYTKASKELINKARPGDTYTFTNVKAKCPGDAAGRKINSLVFMIK